MRMPVSATWLLLLSVASSACGGLSREPGFQPEELLDWTLRDTSVAYAACTDASRWRDPFEAFEFDRRVVQLSASGTTAQLLNCNGWECLPADPPIILSVSGPTLQYTGSRATAISSAPGCLLNLIEDLHITDLGAEMVETVRYQVHLQGDASACAQLEQEATAAGTTGFGLEGCQVTFTSRGTL